MLMPSAVASSMAAMPAFVTGIFTIMFGANAANRLTFSKMAAVFR